ncbi:uncharacterized protein PV09_03495 [Verruconis gallopava]|uniref:HAM1-like N-terminal domain-containing protein n=1 Tax=Verruconis gallopava TaxID=253628 RepID=A0A0D2B2V1_9PEZI|nr:uncharacterized protein PV09_03495 [Verruconis gallopava]KIW05624.1 hypothetical protein PV09_03495 [Verruconis gallopava]
MSSCLGRRKARAEDEENAPLIPQYRDDTMLQRELHQKLHTYQMLRALGQGYMPSNEQLVVHLRTLLAADILNPDLPNLSDSGRLLVRYAKQLLGQFMQLLQNKNGNDQIQDFLWYLSKAKVSVDVDDIAQRASRAKSKADTAAAYRSLQTVGSLLLTNSDFRLFLSDLNVVAREVFKDTAFALSGAAEEAGKKLEPSEDEQQKLKQPGGDDGPRPSGDELGKASAEVADVVLNGASQVAEQAKESVADKLSGDEGRTLLHRLKQAVLKLRQRQDYSDSVSTISLLIKRYAQVYSRAVQETVETAEEDVHENAATDRAIKNLYSFVRSFGDAKQWDELESRFKQLLSHKDSDPEFEKFMNDVGTSIEKLLTEPAFFDQAEEKFEELKQKSKEIGSDSTLRQDADAFLEQCQRTLSAVLQDKDVANLIRTSQRIIAVLSPKGAYVNGELIQDAIDVFLPLAVQAIQYVPIPRLEISTPELDLLLENLIIEPGRTVNQSSFFPYRIRVETYNDLEIRKARFRTTSKVSSTMTIKIDGLSARADEIGFWLRAHKGLLRLADEGIASFQLDERGVDVHLDVEICKDKLEKMVSLKAVRVHVHKLNYQMRRSKFSLFGWLLKPLLRPLVRKVVERQLAAAIADAIHAANRELLYARERLRATRIANPHDLRTFFKAVAARLAPEDDPDVYTRLGVSQPGRGVFKGVYAPGSIVKLWNEEAAQAAERVEAFREDGWRNEIFDVHARYMA